MEALHASGTSLFEKSGLIPLHLDEPYRIADLRILSLVAHVQVKSRLSVYQTGRFRTSKNCPNRGKSSPP